MKIDQKDAEPAFTNYSINGTLATRYLNEVTSDSRWVLTRGTLSSERTGGWMKKQ